MHTIDHIAIGSHSLTQGNTWLKDQLGVTIPPGGKHPLMSTHNCLAQTANNSFLELIAIDPDAPEPKRVRWFTLDDPKTQAELAERPRALCWAVNTTDLEAVVATSPVDLGEIVALTRGDLSWRLTVPADGSLPEDGLLPAFIQWSEPEHPSANMADIGISLQRIRLKHPEPKRLHRLLQALAIEHLAEVVESAEPKLEFQVRRADGEVVWLR